MAMTTDITENATMPPARVSTHRSLYTLLEFKTLHNQLREAEANPSTSELQITAYRHECMKSMVRVLFDESSLVEATEELTRNELRIFFLNLRYLERSGKIDDFPSAPGTFWVWPPTPEFIDCVDHMIFKYLTDLEERHV